MDASSPHRSRKLPAGLRLLVLLGLVVGLIAVSGLAVEDHLGPPDESPAAAPMRGPSRLQAMAGEPGAPGPGGDPVRRTLVLFQHAGPDRELSHEYAIQAANLASRGGSWVMRPVEQYLRGEVLDFHAVIYVGVDSQQRLPESFLADVAVGEVPVLWMGENVDQLFATQPAAAEAYGWWPGGPDEGDAITVEYGGRTLVRNVGSDAPMNRVDVADPGAAVVLGTARHANGNGFPWAVASRNLTYIGEVPFSYVDTKDRYLAAADLILRLVAPEAPDRKRALIRIEDVGPNTDPDEVRQIADLLSARGVPFSLAVYPYYRDPKGTAHQGEPASFRLVDVPALVDALKYARARGGSIVMHGYSHQLEALDNPYDGTSGGDYEFYAAHVDPQNYVQLDGPVPGDSRTWATDRLAVGRAEFVRVGLPDPDIFEFPHYTASAVDYQAVHDMFGVRYDQGTYFAGQCPAGVCSTTDDPGSHGLFQQYFPYPVRDVYGSVVIPENLKNISMAYNNNPPRSTQDIIDNARAMTVVRDAVASSFFHPYLPLPDLERVVSGIQELGFTFVTPYEIIGVDMP